MYKLKQTKKSKKQIRVCNNIQKVNKIYSNLVII